MKKSTLFAVLALLALGYTLFVSHYVLKKNEVIDVLSTNIEQHYSEFQIATTTNEDFIEEQSINFLATGTDLMSTNTLNKTNPIVSLERTLNIKTNEYNDEDLLLLSSGNFAYITKPNISTNNLGGLFYNGEKVTISGFTCLYKFYNNSYLLDIGGKLVYVLNACGQGARMSQEVHTAAQKGYFSNEFILFYDGQKIQSDKFSVQIISELVEAKHKEGSYFELSTHDINKHLVYIIYGKDGVQKNLFLDNKKIFETNQDLSHPFSRIYARNGNLFYQIDNGNAKGVFYNGKKIADDVESFKFIGDKIVYIVKSYTDSSLFFENKKVADGVFTSENYGEVDGKLWYITRDLSKKEFFNGTFFFNGKKIAENVDTAKTLDGKVYVTAYSDSLMQPPQVFSPDGGNTVFQLNFPAKMLYVNDQKVSDSMKDFRIINDKVGYVDAKSISATSTFENTLFYDDKKIPFKNPSGTTKIIGNKIITLDDYITNDSSYDLFYNGKKINAFGPVSDFFDINGKLAYTTGSLGITDNSSSTNSVSSYLYYADKKIAEAHQISFLGSAHSGVAFIRYYDPLKRDSRFDIFDGEKIITNINKIATVGDMYYYIVDNIQSGDQTLYVNRKKILTATQISDFTPADEKSTFSYFFTVNKKDGNSHISVYKIQ